MVFKFRGRDSILKIGVGRNVFILRSVDLGIIVLLEGGIMIVVFFYL